VGCLENAPGGIIFSLQLSFLSSASVSIKLSISLTSIIPSSPEGQAPLGQLKFYYYHLKIKFDPSFVGMTSVKGVKWRCFG
jgi:hypothetical protein